MNAHINPSFIIQLGDLIQDDKYSIDLQNYSHGLNLLSRLRASVYHLVGNHDQVNISEQELCKLLDLESLYYSFDHDGYHFICLFAKVTKRNTLQSQIDRVQLDWLCDDLSHNIKPAIVFVHYSLADLELRANFWFKDQAQACLVDNRAEVRKILEQSKQVVCVFNGHLHWNHVSIQNKIPYLTIQSPIENFQNNGIPANSYAVVEVSDRLHVTVLGNDTMQAEFICDLTL
jgi:hypothetical protein